MSAHKAAWKGSTLDSATLWPSAWKGLTIGFAAWHSLDIKPAWRHWFERIFHSICRSMPSSVYASLAHRSSRIIMRRISASMSAC